MPEACRTYTAGVQNKKYALEIRKENQYLTREKPHPATPTRKILIPDLGRRFVNDFQMLAAHPSAYLGRLRRLT